ncbi:UNVERIFIED_CONTAM: sporulation integral membrane protein YtvI [Acetivibrio alkalicellulosi]
MNINKHTKLTIIAIMILIGIAVGLFLFFRLSIYFAPFILAFAMATSIEPIIRFLMKRAKLTRKVSAIITILSVVTVVIAILVLLTVRLYREAASLSQMVPKNANEIYENVSIFMGRFSDFYATLPREVTMNIDNMFTSFSQTLSELLNSIIRGILNFAAFIPQAFIFLFAAVLSTYFISTDRNRMFNYVNQNLPEKWMGKLLSIKNDIFMTLFGYIRAQLILTGVTFIQLTIGFAIIGIRHFILLSSIIGILDILPIVGPGSVMIPWAIYEFLSGNLKRAVFILILYSVILSVRQMIQPKVLSDQMGLHPLLTLMSLYVGLQVFGYLGVIIGPIAVLLFKNISSTILKKRSIKEFISDYKS